MELKKTVKRIAALGAAGIMLGTTVLSAMAAANLSNYPSPFIKDGKFDGLIVVGKNAAAQDVIGAVDIGTSLQYGMKKTTTTSCGGNVVTIDNGVLIKGTGKEVLNYNEYLGDIRTTALDDEDLPQLLAEGRYKESKGDTDNDVTYTQKIALNNGADLSGYYTYDQPDDGLDAGDYLIFDDSSLAYKYSLDFDDGVQFVAGDANDDFVGSQLEIQGQLYTITAAHDNAGLLDKLTLMAGDTVVWLMQDQPIKKTVSGVDHEIMVVDVNDAEDRCGVSVDGNMVWIDVNSKETINGVEIAVLDAVAVHAQLQDVDVCELNLGATEIKLDNVLHKMKRDGKDIDYAYVDFPNNAAEKWQGFSIKYTPKDTQYLKMNQSYVDPAFGQFKFSFANSMPTDFEDIKASASGSSKGKISFTNNDGKLVELDMFKAKDLIGAQQANYMYWGSSNTRPILFETDTFDCGADARDCKNARFYAITSGGTAHIFEITSYDYGANGLFGTDDKINLYDVTYGRSFTDRACTGAGPTTCTVDMGSLGQVKLDFAGDTVTATELDSDTLAGHHIYTSRTKNGADFTIVTRNGANWNDGFRSSTAGPAEDAVTIKENDIDDTGIVADTITITAQYVTAPTNQLQFRQTSTHGYFTDVNKIYDDNTVDIATTFHGTHVEYDNDKWKWVNIHYPSEEVYANVFVAPVSAVVSYTGGNVETTTLEKLNIGSAVLDTEVSDVTNNNMIVVGGPCINKVAATLMGKADYACGADSGIPENKGVIKLFEQTTGKVAMLVAGWEAMDTRRAARVVAKYSDYALSGTDVVVTGTSLTDIKVEKAQ